MNTPYETPNSGPPKSSGKKWLIFGCLGCFGVLAVCGGIMTFGGYWAMGIAFNNSAVKEAKSLAENSQDVKNAIGTPIEFEFPPDVVQNGQNATYTYRMKGPIGSGTLHFEATQKQGAVDFDLVNAEAKFPGGNTVKLK